MDAVRVLDAEAVLRLDDHISGGGGRGLDIARRLGPAGIIEHVAASGLRGRGGAGFPTGTKWQTVAANASPTLRTTVVVNGAEGEPGTFKDRAILRANPFRVIEGALIAALALGADLVVFALKASAGLEVERVRCATAEVEAAGWASGVTFEVIEGPSEYLYGEETAMLEVLDGRAPFPRIAPPYRHGVDEVGEAATGASETAMAGAGTGAPPTLVNNVETFANVPGIIAEGPAWFRELGTEASPGTIVCTISGRTKRHGVVEVPMGTPLRDVIDAVGGGTSSGGAVVAVVSGVANPLVPAALLDTPLTYEDMDAIGSGLGAGGFIVLDDETDVVAFAHGVSRFLAVESCGQCTPCKQDGLAIAGLLDALRRSEAEASDRDELESRLVTVSDEARCYLALQQQRVISSVLALFPERVHAHLERTAGPAELDLIAPILDIIDDRAVLDERLAEKQPDWTFDVIDSGQSPADRIDQAGS